MLTSDFRMHFRDCFKKGDRHYNRSSDAPCMLARTNTHDPGSAEITRTVTHRQGRGIVLNDH